LLRQLGGENERHWANKKQQNKQKKEKKTNELDHPSSTLEPSRAA
jgi:hypothetical protein